MALRIGDDKIEITDLHCLGCLGAYLLFLVGLGTVIAWIVGWLL